MLINLFGYLSDGRAPLARFRGFDAYFALQSLLPVFLPCALKIKAKLVKNWSILHFLKYFFDYMCILRLRIIKRANLMLLKLSF